MHALVGVCAQSPQNRRAHCVAPASTRCADPRYSLTAQPPTQGMAGNPSSQPGSACALVLSSALPRLLPLTNRAAFDQPCLVVRLLLRHRSSVLNVTTQDAFAHTVLHFSQPRCCLATPPPPPRSLAFQPCCAGGNPSGRSGRMGEGEAGLPPTTHYLANLA